MGIYSEDEYLSVNSGRNSVVIGDVNISVSDIILAAVETNNLVRELGCINLANNPNLPLFETLGQTNISTLFSEVFVTLLCDSCDGIIANPFEKGRPDICIISDESAEFLTQQGYYGIESFPTGTTSDWNPYPYLGADVKATRSSKNKSNNLVQYVLGQEGSHTVSWASHHGRHSRIFGIVWDFLPGNNGDLNPGIVSVFYNDQLLDTWSERTGGSEDSASTVTSRQSSSGIDLMMAGALICPSDENLRRDFNKLLRYTGDLSDYYPTSKRGVKNRGGIDSTVLSDVAELDAVIQHRGLSFAAKYRRETKIALLELDDMIPDHFSLNDLLNARVVDRNFIQKTDSKILREMIKLESFINYDHCRDLLRSIHCIPTNVHIVNIALFALIIYEDISIPIEINQEIVASVNEAQFFNDEYETSFNIGHVRMRFRHFYNQREEKYNNAIAFENID